MSQVLHSLSKPLKIRWWDHLFDWADFKHEWNLKRRQLNRMFDEDCKRMRLEGDLAKYMLIIKQSMNQRGLPLDNRSVILGKDSWPKQYKAGINRMVGIDIEWRDGLV